MSALIPEYCTIDLLRGSTVFSLSDGVLCKCTGIQGVGLLQSERMTEQGPLQHGVTDRGFRAKERLIRLMLFYQVATPTEYWDRRNSLNTALEPTTRLAQLRFDLGNGTRRQIWCSILGSVMDMRPDSAGGSSFAVDFMCPNPAFYDPNGKALIFGLDYSATTFQIPMEIPLGIGQSTIDASALISYGGSWRSYPYRIRISGPMTDCVITNETTGEKLDFTGVSIAAGDRRDIDLRYSYKSVIDATGTNKIADLTSDSDLTSWHLATAREVPDGSNSIAVTGTGVTSATEIYISYHEYFNGI